MTFLIRRTCPPEALASAEIRRYALPEGFPLLVDSDRAALVEPVVAYLASKLLRGRRYSQQSAVAYVDDLRDWFYYLKDVDWPWDEVDEEHIKSYLGQLAEIVSPVTGARYSNNTIFRRAHTLVSFYLWATKEGLLKTEINFEWRTAPSGRQAIRARTGGETAHRPASGLIPTSRSGTVPVVRVLRPPHYRALVRAMDYASEDDATSSGPRRDHLICDWMLQTGMRINEVLSLELPQIERLAPETKNPLDYVELFIDKTKGLNPRIVLVPIWLMESTFAYIEGERHDALRLKSLAHPSSHPLFLHRPSAHNPSGKGVTYRAIHKSFASACLRSGLTREVTTQNVFSGGTRNRLLPLYHPHILRHTFAVYSYLVSKRLGIAEPWKRIQALLGHKYLETTINMYLRSASALEQDSLHQRIAERFQHLFSEEAGG